MSALIGPILRLHFGGQWTERRLSGRTVFPEDPGTCDCDVCRARRRDTSLGYVAAGINRDDGCTAIIVLNERGRQRVAGLDR